ncbi:transposase [Chryseobacterium tongliaoense]|uniref:transposase n=1 Tax=Chryseobacterium tongliaoense TaxID=3240933 RepID=UPI00351448B0
MISEIRNVHIGFLIKQQVIQSNVDLHYICHFFSSDEQEIYRMYSSRSLDTKVLLKWCRLLEYDFFKVYSESFRLYSTKSAVSKYTVIRRKKRITSVRQKLYTNETKDLLINLIITGQKSIVQIVKEYNISKPVIYGWLRKYTKYS